MHIRANVDASFKNLPGVEARKVTSYFLLMPTILVAQWTSSRAKRVVQSTLAAEMLSLNDEIDSTFYLSKLLHNVLPVNNRNLKVVTITNNKSAVDAVCSASSVWSPSSRRNWSITAISRGVTCELSACQGHSTTCRCFQKTWGVEYSTASSFTKLHNSRQDWKGTHRCLCPSWLGTVLSSSEIT